MSAKIEVTIHGHQLKWNADMGRYVLDYEGWLFVVETRDSAAIGVVYFLDVLIWNGEYPTLEVLVDRMETWLGKLRDGATSAF